MSANTTSGRDGPLEAVIRDRPETTAVAVLRLHGGAGSDDGLVQRLVARDLSVVPEVGRKHLLTVVGAARAIGQAVDEVEGIESAYLDDRVEVPCAGHADDVPPVRGMPWLASEEAGLGRLNDGLAEVARRLGATSYAAYVRQPATERYHLCVAAGFAHVEPLTSWWWDGVPAEAVEGPSPDDPVALWGVADAAPQGQDSWPPPPVSAKELDRLVGLTHLFGTFHDREWVASVGRVLCRVGGEPASAACFYFPKVGELDSDHRSRLEEVGGWLAGIPTVLAAAVGVTPDATGALAELRPVGGSRLQSRLADDVGPVLDAAVRVLGGGKDLFVTFHQFFREDGRLDLFDARGRLRRDGCATQVVGRGEGVISWVALRGQGLLIRDLRSSPYAAIHRQVSDPPTRSELAVPVVGLDGRLLGVLNAECTRPAAFTPGHYQAITALAARLGLLVMLFRSRRAAHIWRVLNGLPARDPGGPPSHPEAKALCALFAADLVHILTRPAAGSEFNHRAAYSRRDGPSGTEPAGRPRQGGWSEYVSATGLAVWLTGLNDRRFDPAAALFWSKARRRWLRLEELPAEEGLRARSVALPKDLNPGLEVDVACELGIPQAGGRSELVAWVKYFRGGAAGRLAAHGETLTTLVVTAGRNGDTYEVAVPMPWLMGDDDCPAADLPAPDERSGRTPVITPAPTLSTYLQFNRGVAPSLEPPA